MIFQLFYIMVLISCFVLALGNRPQGSNRYYMSMVYFWVILMAYLTFASIFITVKSVQKQLETNTFSFGLLFSNTVFSTLIVSLLATWAMYLIASLLFFDPWHMFTCFVQYILLTPTYINILNVYAFCNTHDITWGTKGDDKAVKLPSANLKPGGKVDVDIPQDDGDLNDQYEREMSVISQKAPKEVSAPHPADKQEDYYKGFRSTVVLAWIFSNLALCGIILSTGLDRIDVSNTAQTEEQRAIIYMKVILYSVAALSLFRFIGAMWFLIVRMVSLPLLRSVAGVANGDSSVGFESHKIAENCISGRRRTALGCRMFQYPFERSSSLRCLGTVWVYCVALGISRIKAMFSERALASQRKLLLFRPPGS